MEPHTKFQVTFRPIDSTMNRKDRFEPLDLSFWESERIVILQLMDGFEMFWCKQFREWPLLKCINLV